ncbi:MAG: hypothetical protein WCX70_00880 [Candidatus Paceibacterota bacterium]|jgi:hypothetical protein
MDNETITQATPTPTPEIPKSLMSVGALLKKAWLVYKDKIWLAVGILAAPVILMTLTSLVTGPLALVGSLAAVLIMFLAQGALILVLLNRETSLDAKSEIKNAYKKAWSKFWLLLWVGILIAFITIGGFCLFVVPGVILTVWFMFSMVILLAEEERGMKALIKSREYVRDLFWPVLGRYLAMAILVMISYAILGMLIVTIAGNGSLAVILINLTMLFVVPVTVIYQILLYEDLKVVKGAVEIKEQAKTTYLLVGVAGWVFVIIIALLATSLMMSVLGFILGGGLNNIEGLPEKFETSEIQIDIPEEVQEQLKQLSEQDVVL